MKELKIKLSVHVLSVGQNCFQLPTEDQNKTEKGKHTSSGKITSNIISLLFSPNKRKHDDRGENGFFIWQLTEYFIYLTEDVKS